ncbi:MAG: DUF4198 domain-containing protein [Gemmatimonadetes bacterium]|nr:DUF4198 domain-containing protein [Gemmatimonadota bacterium]
MRRLTTAAAAVLLAILLATPALSHDFWLVPHSFRLSPGDQLLVSGQTSSTFPTSLSAVTVDRVASARLLTAHDDQDIVGLSVGGTSLLIRHRPEREGQALVTVAIHPRIIPESPESFRRYIELEGAPEALRRFERDGLLPTDSITRRYAKYAKTLVEVGDGGPRAFERLAGHPLEFVPLTDPAAASSTLRFRMLFLGEPLAHARGHASVAASMDAESAHRDVPFETDALGEFQVDIQSGLWNVRALHIVPAPDGSGADWDVHWATFVWEAAD